MILLTKDDGEKVIVNPNYITRIERHKNNSQKCTVSFHNVDEWKKIDVIDNFDELIDLLVDCKNKYNKEMNNLE